MRFTAPCVAAILLVSAPIAAGHNTRWAWTEPRAERIVMRDATVRLPPLTRRSLENELPTTIALFRNIEQLAWEARDDQAAATFHNFRYRLSTAFKIVQGGLRIGAVECTGSGAASAGRRFKHFRCPVTSEVLEIPSAEVTWDEGETLPTVVEGPPRIVGPVQALLNVHVTGKAAMTYRQTG